MISDVYNTTVNINGDTMFSSSYSPCFCRCRGGMFMNSCFNFGFGGFGGFGSGLGFGVGYTAGMALVPLLPTIFKGIGTAATYTWNNVLKPAGRAIGSAAVWVGNTVAKGAKAVAKGASSLWNSIFHKKSKTEKAEKE